MTLNKVNPSAGFFRLLGFLCYFLHASCFKSLFIMIYMDNDFKLLDHETIMLFMHYSL